MNILLFGASGFIGSRIAAVLRARGHTLTTPSHREADFFALDPARVRPLFAGQDVVVNAVGIMHRRADALETVHHHAPAQLAAWAVEAGVPRWVQLSALGADAAHPVAFVGSKGRGDAAVMASGMQVAIARPSLVYGRGGHSTELFLKLTRLPILALPAGGRFALQPVHVQDVADGMAALVADAPAHGTVINMCGAEVLSLAAYLGVLRQTMHRRRPPRILPIPLALLRPFLPLTNLLSNGVLSAGNIRLLQEGSTADNHAFAALLQRAPLAPAAFAAQP